METTEDHEPTESVNEIERRYDEFEKRCTGNDEAAAIEKAQETERQHMTTTKTQREELVGEAEQQLTTMTAADREKMFDSKEKYFLAVIEKRKTMDRRRRPK